MNTRAASAAAIIAAATSATSAQTVDVERISSGFVDPLFLTHAPGDFERLFVVEQAAFIDGVNRGRVFIIDRETGDRIPEPFLSIPVSAGGERGLLGLAFHPDFQNNGFVYVNYTNSIGDTEIERFTVDPDNPNTVDHDSGDTVLIIDQPFNNHNAGWIDFGPDGFLYIPLGDGGGSGDPQDNGQDTTNLLGSIVRINVDQDDAPNDPDRDYAIPADNPFQSNPAIPDETWAFGLRNPFRNAFDAKTGDLYLADVGQAAREEINVQPASSSGGENYGWNCFEGNLNFENDPDCPTADEATFPIYDYAHNAGRGSITGGEVYRGCAIPELRGTYFFADFLTGEVWSLRWDGQDSFTELQDRTAELTDFGAAGSSFALTSFGRDAFGEIYIVSRQGGTVSRIVAADGSNGCPNPDCPGDTDNDGSVNAADLLATLNNLGNTDQNASAAQGDVAPLPSPDASVNAADLLLILNNFGQLCL